MTLAVLSAGLPLAAQALKPLIPNAFGANASAGGWSTNDVNPRMSADVNGDGKADLVGFALDGVYVALSNGDNTFKPATLWLAGYAVNAGAWSTNDQFPRMLADVNGDGKTDVIGFGKDGVYVSLSNGTSFAQPVKWLSAFSPAQGWNSNAVTPRLMADVNGDKKADVIGFATDGVYVSLSTGSGFGAPQKWSPSFGAATTWSETNTFPRQVADVDGDGKADVIGFGSDGIYVALSTGTAFGAITKWSGMFGPDAAAGGWTTSDLFPRAVADVNGDGKADVVGFANDGVYVSLSTGTSFAPPAKWTGSYGTAAGGWLSMSAFPRVVADINGDGKKDVIGFATDGVYGALSTGSLFVDVSPSSPLTALSSGSSDNNFCWKATYTRGVGVVPGDCGAGNEKQAGLCYPLCAAGMTGVGPLCWSVCPSGYTDIGVSCAKPAATSSAGYAWKFGDTAFSLEGARSRCTAANASGCYTSGAIVYPNCAPNFHKVGDLICSPDCPGGLRDDGAFCAKSTVGRGVGAVGGCAAGTVNDAGLCYPACGPDFDGVGPVCWGKCSGAMPYQCGAGCSLNGATCAAAIGDMAANTVGAAVSILSFVIGGPGITEAARTSATLGRKAAVSSLEYGTAKTLSQHMATAGGVYAKAYAKSMFKQLAIAGNNKYFSAFSVVKFGSLKAFNETTKHFGVMKQEGSFDYSMLAGLDPTGISSAVLAFTKYSTCAVDDFAPSLKTIDMGVIGAAPTEKTLTVNVYQNTTFTRVGASAMLNGCSIVPRSDCVGRTVPAGSTCSITVQATTANSQSLDGEIRLYTTELDPIPYPIELKANSASATPCQPDPAHDEAVNLTYISGTWAYYSDVTKKIIIDADGNITPVNGWAAAGKATVQDGNNRVFKLAFGSGAPALLTLSEFGDTMTGGGAIANRLNWDSRCKAGLQWYAGLCYDVPVGYELTAPGFIGVPCPIGRRDDGTSCWPAWTGATIPAQAEKDSSMSTMKYPILVTWAGIQCPANWSFNGIATCSPITTSKSVRSLVGVIP